MRSMCLGTHFLRLLRDEIDGTCGLVFVKGQKSGCWNRAHIQEGEASGTSIGSLSICRHRYNSRPTHNVQRLVKHSRQDIVFSMQERSQEFHPKPFSDTIRCDSFEACFLPLFLGHSLSLALVLADPRICFVSMNLILKIQGFCLRGRG